MKALVLAGSRGGPDPVADAAGVPYKCLVPVQGNAMLERVVATLRLLPEIESVRVVANEPARIAHLGCFTNGDAHCTRSDASLSATVAGALDDLGAPLLVTTADHPLLTVEIVRRFLEHADRDDVDVAAGLVPSSAILADHPDAVRTFIRFRDERYSGANLFLLRTPAAINAVRFWRRIEADRKRPWRLARAFGPRLLIGYLLHSWSLDRAMSEVSAVLGVRARAVALPFADAAIDVDKPADLALAEHILACRPVP